MLELYHTDRVTNTIELVGRFETEEEMCKAATVYIEKTGFKSYYWRTWCRDGEHWIDYGHHWKFLYWKKV